MTTAHDRTGEPVEPDDLAATGDHHCRRGWLTRPAVDEPIPCLVCRPWLAERRPPTRAELAAFQARHPKPARTRSETR
jgi:hypothetical protein